MNKKGFVQWFKNLFRCSSSEKKNSQEVVTPDLANTPIGDDRTLPKQEDLNESEEKLFDDQNQDESNVQIDVPEICDEQSDKDLRQIQEDLASEEMLNDKQTTPSADDDVNDDTSEIQPKERELKQLAEELEQQRSALVTQKQDLQAQIESFEEEKSRFEQEKEQSSENASLLSNSAYIALANDCCNMITELERQQTEETADLVRYVRSQVVEGLIMSGADPISEDKEFNVMRHKPVSKGIVKKGTPIVSITEPGVAIGDTVLVKANVQV